jgi:hypothetical protein
MCIDTNYIKELENEHYRSLKKYSIHELAEIFPEAKEVLKEQISETKKKLKSAFKRAKKSYLHSLREPEVAFLCEAATEIIFEEEIIVFEKRLRQLTYQYDCLIDKNIQEEIIDIEALKERLDLKQIIEGYGFKLRKSGQSWLTLCPFHNERTPSFNVYKKHFYCFGCQAHGDVFNFIQEIEKVNFKEALNKLKIYA